MNEEEHEGFWIEPNVVVRANGQIDKYCGLDFCQRGRYARNLCSSHYEAWRRGKPLKPIISPLAIGATPCVYQGCDGVAVTRMPGSKMLCGAHVTQFYKGRELRPVGYRQDDGYNEERTARVCRVCGEEKPVSEFYDRNQTLGVTCKSTKCKGCFIKDSMYYQGKRNTKSDGTDPKNYQNNPEAMKARYEFVTTANRERARKNAEKKND